MNQLGNPALLGRTRIALLCSIQRPGDIILKTLDLMQELRNTAACVVSGFHSPVERECLNILLRGPSTGCGIAICYARSLPKRIPAELKKAIESNRLLILSACDDRQSRATEQTSAERNRIVGALADVVFVPYASPGGKTEALGRELLSLGMHVLTLRGDYNAALLDAGASAIGTAFEMPVCSRSLPE